MPNTILRKAERYQALHSGAAAFILFLGMGHQPPSLQSTHSLHYPFKTAKSQKDRT
jgi:hypothetical protein